MARRRRPPQPAWAAFQALLFVLVAIGVTDYVSAAGNNNFANRDLRDIFRTVRCLGPSCLGVAVHIAGRGRPR